MKKGASVKHRKYKSPGDLSKNGRVRFEMVLDQFHKGDLRKEGKEVESFDDAYEMAMSAGQAVGDLCKGSQF